MEDHNDHHAWLDCPVCDARYGEDSEHGNGLVCPECDSFMQPVRIELTTDQANDLLGALFDAALIYTNGDGDDTADDRERSSAFAGLARHLVENASPQQHAKYLHLTGEPITSMTLPNADHTDRNPLERVARWLEAYHVLMEGPHLTDYVHTAGVGRFEQPDGSFPTLYASDVGHLLQVADKARRAGLHSFQPEQPSEPDELDMPMTPHEQALANAITEYEAARDGATSDWVAPLILAGQNVVNAANGLLAAQGGARPADEYERIPGVALTEDGTVARASRRGGTIAGKPVYHRTTDQAADQ